MPHLPAYPYRWHCKVRLGRYFGQPCKLLVAGRNGHILVEFPDGYKARTSVNYIRKRRKPQ